jgi:hypothetical protein
MADWQFEKFKEGGYGFVTPDQVTASNPMVKSMIDWGRKVQAGEADGKDFAQNVVPLLRGLDQFLALGFEAKAPVREL